MEVRVGPTLIDPEPTIPPKDAETLVEPIPIAVTKPVPPIEAMLGTETVQTTEPVRFWVEPLL